jgi:hypothetical protein
MCADMIAHELNRLDLGDNLCVPLFQNGDEFLLTLARVTLPQDDARTGVECGKYMQGPTALIFMLIAMGNIPRLSGPRRSKTRTRLSGGFLINGQDHLVILQETCVEVDELRDGGIKDGIAWVLGIQPEMMAPGFEVMARQNPPDGRGGDTLNHALSDELARQFGAIPLGEAAAQRIRTFAGEAYHVDRDLRGKNHPWPRGQGRRRARPGAAPESV